MWEFENYLRQQRRVIDDLFDYRYSQLPLVFAQLIREGHLDESRLAGLSEDKRETIRSFLSLWRTGGEGPVRPGIYLISKSELPLLCRDSKRQLLGWISRGRNLPHPCPEALAEWQVTLSLARSAYSWLICKRVSTRTEVARCAVSSDQ